MASPTNLKFSESHEWIRVDGESATIGISDYAQTELGDITYLELPDVGAMISAKEPLGVIESVKAATDIYAPASGEVVERNETAVDQPELVNQSPYEDAWLLKIKLSDPAQLETLMDSLAYDDFLKNEAH